MNIFQKTGLYFKLFWRSLFLGMRNAEIVLTTNQKDKDASNLEVLNKGESNVFNDIMEQKLTQEVEELRYSSYKVANESRKYKYVGNGTVVKKNKDLIEQHVNIDESDNLPIILIQDNFLIYESVLDTLNEVNKTDKKDIYNKHLIKIKYEIFPRFLLDDYVKKIVLKESNGNYVLDLYCSKYPSQFNERRDKSFIREIKKVKDGLIKNVDFLDITNISFITSKAWGVDDYIKFSFKDFELHNIVDFDGNYIIRLGCKSEIFMENILDKVFSESAEKKYINNEARKGKVIETNIFFQSHKEEDFSSLNLENLKKVKFSIEK